MSSLTTANVAMLSSNEAPMIEPDLQSKSSRNHKNKATSLLLSITIRTKRMISNQGTDYTYTNLSFTCNGIAEVGIAEVGIDFYKFRLQEEDIEAIRAILKQAHRKSVNAKSATRRSIVEHTSYKCTYANSRSEDVGFAVWCNKDDQTIICCKPIPDNGRWIPAEFLVFDNTNGISNLNTWFAREIIDIP